MKKKQLLKTSFTAVMGALAYVVFTFLQIKIPLPGGTATSFHLGNAVCILAALLIDGKCGGIAGALGMGMGDLFVPEYVMYAPKTIILKFLIGFISGTVAHKIGKINMTNDRKHIKKWTVIAASLGMLFNFIFDPLFGYVYNILIIGKNAAELVLTWNVLSTGVNALASVLVVSLLYLPIRNALSKAGIFDVFQIHR